MAVSSPIQSPVQGFGAVDQLVDGGLVPAPLLDYNFAEHRNIREGQSQFDERISFTRASAGTYFDQNGVMRTAGAGVTNIALSSETIVSGDVNWTVSSTTTLTNQETAPDGTDTMDKLTEVAASSLHYIRQGITLSLSTPYVFSIFAKKGSGSHKWLGFGNNFASGAGGQRVGWFDLENGVVGGIDDNSTGQVTTAIEDFGNGVYRCFVICTEIPNTSAFIDVAIASADNERTAFLGDVNEHIFVWGAQLEESSTVGRYVPTTTAAATGAYEPRFDHDPAGGVQNYCLQSEGIGLSPWTIVRSTIDTDSTVAPDGTTTADTIIEASDTSQTHYIQQVLAVTTGLPYTWSVYAKIKERTQVRLFMTTTGFPAVIDAYYDLENGTIISTGGAEDDAVIEDVGGGWFRLSLSATSDNSVDNNFLVLPALGGTDDYDGDGVSGVYVWGAQLNLGSAPSTYVPTWTRQARSDEWANLLVQSEDFSTIWVPNGVTVTTDNATAPDGNLTADKLVEDGGAGGHLIEQTTSPLFNNTPYAGSVYIKAAENTFALFILGGNAFPTTSIGINLTTGAATNELGSPFNIKAENVGDGWFRCSFAALTTAAGTSTFNVYNSEDGLYANRNYSGDSSSGIYVWGAQLNVGKTPGPYVHSDGFPVKSFRAKSLGLLIEEQRENVCLQSEDLGTTWSLNGAAPPTLSANAGLALDGILTADELTFGAGVDSRCEIDLTTTTSANTEYTFSIYARLASGSTDTFRIGTNDDVSGDQISSDFTATSAWQRFSFTLTYGAASTFRSVFIRNNAAGDAGVILFWGAQLEEAAFPTSYIATTTAAVTRSADVATIALADVPGFDDGGVGTLYAEYEFPQVQSTDHGVCEITNGTANRIGFSKTGSNWKFTIVDTVTQTNLGENLADTNLTKSAATWETDNIRASTNGSAIETDPTASIPTTLDIIEIGSDPFDRECNGFIHRLAYWPQRLPDATLQSLTS